MTYPAAVTANKNGDQSQGRDMTSRAVRKLTGNKKHARRKHQFKEKQNPPNSRQSHMMAEVGWRKIVADRTR